MYPLSKLRSLPLKQAGLEIPVDEIYKEDGTGLVNALVRIDGCTGSFISNNGLIITNHHCVYGTVASLSTVENNYLKDGFAANSEKEELMTGKKCRITLDFKDVSDQVLEGINKSTTPEVRAQLIASNRKKILEALPDDDETILYEISEMLTGTEFTLFTYKMLNDVRIVYVPPQSVGKFGGETDNWVWPRHNADFSIVRAYENGKPYQPEEFFHINQRGAHPEDFAFILGYPGRTYRHTPAQFLTYQERYILPVIADYFEYQIATLERMAGNDEELKLKYASRIARLSNTAKNFRGKLQGLRRTSISADRQKVQDYLKKLVKNDDQFAEYRGLFEELDKTYAAIFQDLNSYLYAGRLFSSVGVFNGMATVIQMKDKSKGMSKDERVAFIERNKEGIAARLRSGYKIYNVEADRLFMTRLLQHLYDEPPHSGAFPTLASIAGSGSDAHQRIEAAVKKAYDKTKFTDVQWLRDLWDEKPAKFIKLKDPLFDLVREIQQFYTDEVSRRKALGEELDALLPQLYELKRKAMSDEFIPDANGTLRLTYGHVRGYSPEDAVYHEPLTTVVGIYEKASTADENPDYFMESELLEKMKNAEPADVLKHPRKQEVVTALLYDMDTTGGNSGSPILNARGELIGVNFDRAFTATINDYAWNNSYSRSIGVDIRYVLFVMKHIQPAEKILEEIAFTEE
jgi:hypothetical protein